MDFVVEIANDTKYRFRRLGVHNTPANWKRFLEETLYDNFSKNADKRRFLLTFNRIVQEELEKHKAQCPNTKANRSCQFDNESNAMLFAIDQVLDNVPEYIDRTADSFSTEEQIAVSNKLDEILENFKNMNSFNNAAFEALYEAIQELKGLMNLSKKNWKQLAFGKITEMVAGSVFDSTVGKSISESISHTISHATLPM